MTTHASQAFTVAILMDQPEALKIVSRSLREMGIFAHFYSDMVEFWAQMKLSMPDLCLIDVMKTTDGESAFHKHPLIVKQKLPYALIYQPESAFLLTHITWASGAQGLVHLDDTLTMQLKTLVERCRTHHQNQKQLLDLTDRFEKMQERSLRLIEQSQHHGMFKSHYETCQKIVAGIEEYAQKTDFTSALVRKLTEWNKLKRLGTYQLSPQNQKLISPDFNRTKYISLPSLWLGQECRNGIAPFAREMIYQVAHELFESEPMMINIHGSHTEPDMVLVCEVDEDMRIDFPWMILQQMIESLYRRCQLHIETERKPQAHLDFSTMLDEMDTLHFHQTDSTDKVLMVNLFPLWHFMRKKNRGKFYFEAFFKELTHQVQTQIHSTSRFAQMGPWAMLVMVKSPWLESEFRLLENLMKNFSYWKHFEDQNQLIHDHYLPQIKMISASAYHFFSLMEKEWESGAHGFEITPVKPTRSRPTIEA
jgi:CheY-like chemotaxis protein